jgi:hypothetical protein
MPNPIVGVMGASALVGAAGSIAGANAQENAAEASAEANVLANRENIDFQKWLYEDQKGMAQPFYDIGLEATKEQSNRYMEGEYDSPIWDFQFEEDPGYQFRKEEGTKAIQNQFAARGGVLSGGQRKAAGRFASDLASNEYANAYSREADDYARQVNARDRSFNQISSIAGNAPTALNQINQAGSRMGTSVGNSMIASGQAQADAEINRGNASASMYAGLAQSTNQGLQNYMLYDYMNP